MMKITSTMVAQLAVAALVVAGCTHPDVSGPGTETPVTLEDLVPRDAEEALQWLVDGNARFIAGQPRHGHEEIARRAKLTEGQHPFAILLSCADSRVPPELVFDQGLGDLFVIRVAGNVVAEDEAGSIEYATASELGWIRLIRARPSAAAPDSVRPAPRAGACRPT